MPRLRLITLAALAVISVHSNAQKRFDWGDVSSTRGENGYHLDIRIAPNGGGTGNGRTALWLPGGSASPSPYQTIYVAIPPGMNIEPRVMSEGRAFGAPIAVHVVSGVEQENDSSSIGLRIENVALNAAIPSVAGIRVQGYEWFRGVRLARLEVHPGASGGGSTSEMSVDLRLVPRKDLTSDVRAQATVREDGTIGNLVVNPADVQTFPATSLQWSDTTGGWFSPGGSAVRIAVASDGICRIPAGDLKSIAPALSIVDPRTVRLFNYGVEIPITVTGESDGSFDGGDYVEFPCRKNYGRRDYRIVPAASDEEPEFYDRFTDTSYYWLTWGGAPGLRSSSNAGSAASLDTLRSFTQLVHLERNTMLQYIGNDIVTQQDPRWTAGDMWGWYWQSVYGSTISTSQQTFQASDIDQSDTVTVIRAKLGSWGTTGSNPAHRIRLRINASDTAARADVQPFQIRVVEGSLRTSFLSPGTNTAWIHSLPTASTINQMIVDWIDVEYPRLLNAPNDTLQFSFPRLLSRSPRVIRLTNLATRAPVIYKMRPEARRIDTFDVSPGPPFTVTFRDTVGPGDSYALSDTLTFVRPASLASVSFPDLRNRNRRADYILLTSRAFLSSAQQYASAIASAYGIVPTVIAVEDVFNEFAYGYPNPDGIRNFLKAASVWQSPMPSYVCIAGGGTWDFKHQIQAPTSGIKSMNVVPPGGYPVSDPWLAVLDDSSVVPQYYVGRIPATDANELETYFTKATAYLQQSYDDWNKRTMFFAGGDPNVSGQVSLFKSVADQIINTLVTPHPIGGVATNFYKTSSPQSDFGPYTSAQIQSALDNGALFINYIGHSGTQTWDNGIGDPAQLENTRGRFPLIADFGCSTGRFAEPDIRSFGELFTVGNAGSAIAYVGNSSLGFTNVATSLPVDFYAKFLRDSVREIGKAHLLAKIARLNSFGGPGPYFPSGIGRIMMLTNTLLGDPIIQLAVPKKPNLSTKGLPPFVSPPAPADDLDSLSLVVPFMNTGLYPVDSFSVKITRTFGGNATDTLLKRVLPAFLDTFRVAYGIRNNPGLYEFVVDLNPDAHIDEIDGSDNRASAQGVVTSNAVRLLWPATGFESPAGILSFLNPVSPDPAGENLECWIDTSSTFGTPAHVMAPFGAARTTVPSVSLNAGRKYFWKAGVSGSQRPLSQGSFRVSPDSLTRWIPRDSIAWAEATLSAAALLLGGGYTIGDRSFALHLVSSGFNDGGFGTVEINGAGVLASTFNRGISVTVLDSATLTVLSTQTFDTYGSVSASNLLQSTLDAIGSGVFVAFVVIDEGTMALTAGARSSIRRFGSVYADSLVYPKAYRASWAFLGRPGASAGSMPELFRLSGGGKAIVDTTIVRRSTRATVFSPLIGPAGRWDSAGVDATIPVGSTATVTVLGVRADGVADSLLTMNGSGSTSLSSVEPKRYPLLQLRCDLAQGTSSTAPILRTWYVTARPPAELALNYQTVRVSADSVLEGGGISVSADIWNVGRTAAESTMVTFAALETGGLRHCDTVRIVRLGPDSSVTATFTYSTTGHRGRNILYVSADPSQAVPEEYRSNNVYSLPVVIQADTVRPTFDVTFDGRAVMEGDYVSALPEVRIAVSDNSPLPITNPSDVRVMLDGRRVILATDTPDSLFVPGSGGPASAVIRPHLATGDHVFSFQISDASGNFSDSASSTLLVRVNTETTLKNVLNFPNPFGRETRFTFNLTGSGLPDEVRIRIYTVSGRLINEIVLPRGEVHPGFNAIPWDGRDHDGDEIANGVYFYRIIVTHGKENEESIGKLAKVR